MQTANQEVPSQPLGAPQVRISLPTEKQRETFCLSRANGQSVTASATAAGVSRRTGSQWEKERVSEAAHLKARRGSVATKTEIAAELTRIGLHDDQVAPRDKVNALATAGKLLGYEAPQRIEQVIIHSTVRDWIMLGSEPGTLQAAPAKVLSATGGPPFESASSSTSLPENISKESEK